ncbi:MAG: hypothetical protein IKC15_01990, partial [Kiritimatiellae bacterium]|nr:hypothetical protein [Kiritimatiellia bacterium]
MTKDLEETLSTLDGAHREMVVRMKSCFAPAPAFAVRRRPHCGELAAAALVAVAACVLTGFCTAMMWPGTLILMEEKIPHPGVTAYALMATFGDFG